MRVVSICIYYVKQSSISFDQIGKCDTLTEPHIPFFLTINMPSLSFDSSNRHRPMLVDKAASGVKTLFATSFCEVKQTVTE